MSNSSQIFYHPQQKQMQVEIILASQPKSKHHQPIYTIRFRYPRPIHSEIMTHRVFSRNARSSRAVPVRTMLNEVRTTPYVPWHWGKNQKGMQASEECNSLVVMTSETNNCHLICREEAWLQARDAAADAAEAFMDAGYHKQNPNRLLEPFSWIDTLITATDWDNFLWLRDHKDAEPHLQDLARLLKKAMNSYEVRKIKMTDWHQPYITSTDIQNLINCPDKDTKQAIDELNCNNYMLLNMVSAARCARISYKAFNGNDTYRAEFDRYKRLVTSDRVHASPLEHQAIPDNRTGVLKPAEKVWENPHLHGNFTGYIQARKLILNEVYTSN